MEGGSEGRDGGRVEGRGGGREGGRGGNERGREGEGEGGKPTLAPRLTIAWVVPMLTLLANVPRAGGIAFDAPVAHGDAAMLAGSAGRPRATFLCCWPFLALAPWPAGERAPGRPSRREPCSLNVASDVDDSVQRRHSENGKRKRERCREKET